MTKKLVQDQFGPNAAAYVTSEVHAKGESLGRLVTLVQPQAKWRVLDVATGAGHTALAFAPHVAEVVATDITPQMLQQTAVLAQERGITNLTTEPADAENLPFGDGAFDLVTCRIAPHHFPDVPWFVAESARVLRSGGWLAVADNVAPAGAAGAYVNAFEKLRDPSHGRCLTVAEWTAAYEAAGLTATHVGTLWKRLVFDPWARRLTDNAALVEQVRTMLLAASGATREFLRPENGEKLTFRLQEGIFIGRKEG